MAVRRRAVLGGMLAGAAALATTGCLADTFAETTDRPSKGAEPKQDKQTDRITVVATGDVLLHERLWTSARRDGDDGQWDFAPLMASVKPLVQKADLAIAHLETPLAELGGPYHGYPLFQGPPQIATALKQTGYDLCTTASNHSFDGGAAGVDRTLDALDKVGLAHAGTARTRSEAEGITIVNVNGVKVASLSFTFGFNGLPYPNGETWRAAKISTKSIQLKAQDARDRGADLVIVSCHWGTEYSNKLNDQQREVGPELLANSNIDLVIGHHAHVVQPMQQIDGKWIAYGHGNLVAAHREPNTTKAEGLLTRFTFTRNGGGGWTTEAEYAPLLMTDDLPVRVLDVRRELAKDTARRQRLELAQRRTTETVTALGSAPKML
ncbi:CapA family protein [Kribbella jejuensis]|uniref:Poly-gamma-glutamate synthesis protein (Capsule biosynthesis protein) n=1 Tax=Kribbella jejuensis TaxID=236068 RepID=A0A542ER68_9ACTN|nr:CapA family protein [Kribbella jejuensis]TQJ17857.1 poly-gamma-glutamate synthesis protein (capsule biosynthesis protein) [Kribbella jejuensis]